MNGSQFEEVSDEMKTTTALTKIEMDIKTNIKNCKAILKDSNLLPSDFDTSTMFDPFLQDNHRVRIFEIRSKTVEWAKKNNWQFIKKSQNSSGFPISHNSYNMDGQLAIPYVNIPEYRQNLATDILENRLFYLCEFPTSNKIKLTFDVDYESEEPLSKIWEQAFKIVFIFVQEVRQFFPSLPDSKYQVVICFSLPSIRTRNDKTLNKFGIHAYFDNIVVDRELFFHIRNHIIETCKKKISILNSEHFSNQMIQKIWEARIDKGVITNGLRLIFARKPEKCPYTPPGLEKCSQCSVCGGSKGVPSSTFYIPFLIFKNNELDKKSTAHLHNWKRLSSVEQLRFLQKMIEICSIRPYATGVKEEKDIVVTDSVIPSNIQIKRIPTLNQKKRTLTEMQKPEHTGGEAKRPFKELPKNSAIYTFVSNLFKEAEVPFENENFRNLPVSKLSMNTPHSNVLTISTNLKFCLQLGKQHKHCTIYFIMKRKKGRGNQTDFILTQKCRCPHPPCNSFESTPCYVPKKYSEEIFKTYLTKLKENPCSQKRKKIMSSKPTPTFVLSSLAPTLKLEDSIENAKKKETHNRFVTKQQIKKKELRNQEENEAFDTLASVREKLFSES